MKKFKIGDRIRRKDMPLADTKMRVDHIAEHERRGEL